MRNEDKPITDKLSVIELMTLTLYGESRGESWEGKIAIAYVILNRSRLWHKTIRDVCLAKNQFSCWNSNDYNYAILINLAKAYDANMPNNKALQLCQQCAEMAYLAPAESTVDDATFYRVKGTKNKWFDNAVKTGTLVYLKSIKTHEFYKEAI